MEPYIDKPSPRWADKHAEIPVAYWGELTNVVRVFACEALLEMHFDVTDEMHDALIEGVISRCGAIGPHDDPDDLVIMKGYRALAIIHRRPGQPATVTRFDDQSRAASQAAS